MYRRTRVKQYTARKTLSHHEKHQSSYSSLSSHRPIVYMAAADATRHSQWRATIVAIPAELD